MIDQENLMIKSYSNNMTNFMEKISDTNSSIKSKSSLSSNEASNGLIYNNNLSNNREYNNDMVISRHSTQHQDYES